MMDLFVFVGEQSGDVHGSNVLKHLSHLDIGGVAGPKMRALGIQPLLPMEEFQVMGFTDVICALPRLRRHFNFLLKKVLEINPKTVLFIDYPGFNLRMAKALRQAGYKGKLIHYISPSVWAWKKNRVESMAKTLDLLLCIFPFEPAYFAHTTLKTLFVGNPTLEEIQTHTYDPTFHLKGPIVSLFPGSRKEEIRRNLPTMLAAAKQLQKEDPSITLCISVANTAAAGEIPKDIAILVPAEHTYDLMKASTLAIAKCGTVILELALHGVPTVVTYKVSRFNYFIGKHIFRIRLSYFSLPNILLNRQVFPELIFKDFTVENTYQHAKKLYTSNETCLNDLHELRNMLATDIPAGLLAAQYLR